MKKLIIALSLTLLFGCSSDSNSPNDNLFLNINIAGTTYPGDGIGFFGFSDEENCLNNGGLFLLNVGQVENSSIFIDCYLVSYENDIDFNDPSKNVITNSRITDINDLFEFSFNEDVCSLNNDFSIIYEDKLTNELLRFKPGAPKNHTVTNVQFISEDETSKFYIVEGNFSATFLKGNTDVPVSGNYRTKIDVFK